MEHIHLDSGNKEKYNELLKKAAELLKSGKVIIYPTDTLYGLGANALDEDAILKVFKIKKQDRRKPISVIVKDMAMARKIACIGSKVEKILQNIWPGQITVVLRKKDSIPYLLTGNGETVGIRIPANDFVSSLMKHIDFPITATSANISGSKDLVNPKDIIKTFGRETPAPDMFIDSGIITNPEPSTIIDLTTNIPKVVRIGAIGKDKILKIIKQFV